MTRDRSNNIIITHQPADAPARRVIYEPVTAGGYNRIEQVRSGINGKGWRTLGGERVESVRIETPD